MNERESASHVVQPKLSELSIVAAICGIVAISNPWQGFALAIVAIVLGIRARSAIDAAGGTVGGSALATTGMVCGIVSLAMSIMYFALMVLIFLGALLPMFLIKCPK